MSQITDHLDLKKLPAGTEVIDKEGDLAVVQPDGSIIYQFEPEAHEGWEPWLPNSLCRSLAPFSVVLPSPVPASSVA